VFAKSARSETSKRAVLVWREPLLWAAADTFDLVTGCGTAARPVSRAIGFSREAALAALNDKELTWEIVYTSPSLTGRCGAGSARGPSPSPRLPASALIAGLRNSRCGRGAAAAS